MSRLPVCSGADAVKAFRKFGYEVDHQSGTERQPYYFALMDRPPLTVPNYHELAKGTLRALIREAGLTKEQFSESL